jgi:hypothetical protein
LFFRNETGKKEDGIEGEHLVRKTLNNTIGPAPVAGYLIVFYRAEVFHERAPKSPEAKGKRRPEFQRAIKSTGYFI